MPDGTRCAQPGCTGTIADGYCNVCGTPAHQEELVQVVDSTAVRRAGIGPELSTRSAASSMLASAALGSKRARQAGSVVTRRTGSSQRLRSARLGGGITTVRPAPTIDAEKALLTNPVVPEGKRFCPQCGEAVGRGRDGQPGRTTGFCANCRHPFSFDAKLRPGDLVAGQYEVAGCLAHGGLGWIYLAKDKNVSDRWVVLKGLLNSADPDALAAAIAEQRFLAQVSHPSIVEIYNFVTHDDAGYIVMEYVGGTSLKSILKQRMQKAGFYDPLPVDQALAYILEILPAFQYLHDLGLVYCDFKPDNIIQVGDEVKLIDLGGVRRIDDEDSAIFGTVGYQAPEVAELGTSVASDIYTIGRTLVVLTMEFRGYQSTYLNTLPPQDSSPIFQKYDSFYRLVSKACAPNRDDRFVSADELRSQMIGVLREVVAIDRGSGAATTTVGSLLFDAPTPGDEPDDWRNLPTLRRDPHDPQTDWLHAVTGNPEQRLAVLREAPARTAEVLLDLARTALEHGTAATSPRSPRASCSRTTRGSGAPSGSRASPPWSGATRNLPRPRSTPSTARSRASSHPSSPWLTRASRPVTTRSPRTSTSRAPGPTRPTCRWRPSAWPASGLPAATSTGPWPPTASSRPSRAPTARPGPGSPSCWPGPTGACPTSPRPCAPSTTRPSRRGAGPRSRRCIYREALETVERRQQGRRPPRRPPGHPEPGLRVGLEQALRELARRTPDPSERVPLVDEANAVRPWSLW